MTGLINPFSARQVKNRTCIDGFRKTRRFEDGFFKPVDMKAGFFKTRRYDDGLLNLSMQIRVKKSSITTFRLNSPVGFEKKTVGFWTG